MRYSARTLRNCSPQVLSKETPLAEHQICKDFPEEMYLWLFEDPASGRPRKVIPQKRISKLRISGIIHSSLQGTQNTTLPYYLVSYMSSRCDTEACRFVATGRLFQGKLIICLSTDVWRPNKYWRSEALKMKLFNSSVSCSSVSFFET